LATATTLSFAGIAGLATESASAATGTPITIALVCTCSGAGAPTYQGVTGAFHARVDYQNAHGGVNGHKISTLVLDDQTSPTQAATAVQEAVSHGVLGIVSVSALFFEGAKYAQQAGIPVTGSFQDGPEWGMQPNTNMFASDNGSLDPKYPVNTAAGKFLVSHGGTVVGSYGYSISPSSTRALSAPSSR
jgi:branched-chain amino acid transport system substrate-binding protein